ncbi:MAG: response regulator [Acidobacteria bacterium]|nr:response regulator [Acidobacteriota bacterium]
MMSAAPSQRVLIIDDDEGVRRFVTTALTRQGFESLAVETGEQGLTAAAEQQPSAVILDLSLPGLGGLEICRRIRAWYEGPILVISANGEESTIVQALDLGADDYLTKPFRVNELAARLRALLRRAAADEEQLMVIEVGPITVDLAQRRVFHGDTETRLTKTEFDILACLVRRQNRVVTAETILASVWGPHHGEYAQTLRVHIGHIRRKIEPLPSSPRYIITEPGIGYRFSIPDDKASGAYA